MHVVLFILIITKFLSKQIYETYPLKIDEIEDGKDLNVMHINNDDTLCQKWIPSLFLPILLIPKSKDIPNDYTSIKTIYIKYPIISISASYSTNIYYHNFIGKNEVVLGRVDSNKFLDCYLGLLNKITGFEELEIKDIYLNKLAKDKIFSFDIWSINGKSITSSLYIGNSHEDFISEKKKANIGTCKSKKENLYWGCTFKGLYLKSKFLNLKQKENEYYTIYFSSGSYDIILPKSIENDFNILTEKTCTYDPDYYGYEDYYLTCSILFNEQNYDYEEIKLLGENFNLTIELDNKYRFINDQKEKEKKTRMRYEDVDYFVFPLIMFKNFHVQFNGEKDLISFYAKDSSLIEVEKKKDNNGSSKGLLVLIIILIIIIIVGLAFGVFWFIKKRNSPIERKINKYNKYDEDPNFQDLQGKKVF